MGFGTERKDQEVARVKRVPAPRLEDRHPVFNSTFFPLAFGPSFLWTDPGRAGGKYGANLTCSGAAVRHRRVSVECRSPGSVDSGLRGRGFLLRKADGLFGCQLLSVPGNVRNASGIAPIVVGVVSGSNTGRFSRIVSYHSGGTRGSFHVFGSET